MDRIAAENALMKLAARFGKAWFKQQQQHEPFAGEVIVKTENTIYRFVDAAFAGRANVEGAMATAWEVPLGMKGVHLVGFLSRDGGLWSLAATWKPGALAVITSRGQALTLTSATVSYEQRPFERAPFRRSA